MLYKRILLPIDGSKHSLSAVDHAIRLSRLGGEVLVITIVPPVPNILGGDSRKEAEAELQAEAKAIMQPVLDRLKAENVPTTSAVRHAANAGNGLLAAIDEFQCDLVIMGSRGRTDLEGLLLGSVTHKVLSVTEVPVLVIS